MQHDDDKPLPDSECTNPVWHEIFGGVNLPPIRRTLTNPATYEAKGEPL